MRERIGRYRLLRRLGSGGMGVVYAARDEEQSRDVAVKIVGEARDADACERLRREARTIAQISHPNVCKLFDSGEHDGEPYLVMELLEGESLADRLARGAMPVRQAVDTAIAILAALEALHARAIVHRDLKPSNVYLTPDGVKLLDFGLVRTVPAEHISDDEATQIMERELTRTGMIVGTPNHMAPEQILGRRVDERADLFAAGALLYQMISGRRAFDGETVMGVLHSIVYDQVPTLTGSPAVEAATRVMQRAMAKRPDDRYPTARAMAEALAPVRSFADTSAVVIARAMTRIVVLPFRLLRPDPEIEFLSESLAEAITASLAGLESLVVRSSFSATRLANADIRTVAAELDVDVALTGSLLRSGEVLRVATQLIETTAGTVLWSQTSQVTMRDIFQLEDEVTRRTVDALALPLTEREHRVLNRDVPANPRAYEFYLRAMRLGHTPDDWVVARDLFTRATEEDPSYAPAWARLARAHMLVGKYTAEHGDHASAAESAIRRALDLNPDLPIAQHIYSRLEVEVGRSLDAFRRLTAAVKKRKSDPELFAAIVLAARFCGLLDESIAAHDQARRLDPHILTGVTHTYFWRGDYEGAWEHVEQDIGFIHPLVMAMLGRTDEAIARLRERTTSDPRLALWLGHLRATLEGDADSALSQIDALEPTVRDPEALFYMARSASLLGRADRAFEIAERAVRGGFVCLPAFERDPWLTALRGDDRWPDLLARVRTLHASAREGM